MTDQRSHKVAFVAHCLLNQNAKVEGFAQSPAMVDAVVQTLRDCDVGIVQMPCPECVHFGLGRPTGEDTREQYDVPAYRDRCAALANTVVTEMASYVRHGYRVPFLLGVEGSPSCSVRRVPTRAGVVDGSGLFVAALMQAAASEGIEVAVLGVPESGELGDVLTELRRFAAG